MLRGKKSGYGAERAGARGWRYGSRGVSGKGGSVRGRLFGMGGGGGKRRERKGNERQECILQLMEGVSDQFQRHPRLGKRPMIHRGEGRLRSGPMQSSFVYPG